MRAPLLESPPQPCRPVWAGRHGTADGEEKRGGFHQPSAQAAISREVPLIRETLAMQRSTRSDASACSSEADKRGLEIRAGPAMQSYAICQLPAAVQLNHFNSPSRTDRSHGPSDAYADGEDKRGGFKGAFIPVDVVRRRQLYRETSLLESQPRPRPTCMGRSVRHCELREEKRGLSGLCLCRNQPRCR
jgi:hypothetical protein